MNRVSGPLAEIILHAILMLVQFNMCYTSCASLCDYWISPTEIAMGLQADEQSETIHTAKREDNACICSSLHVQGTFTYTDSHRCPLHNDTLEHDCTSKNIVPGLIAPSDGQLDTPQAVEDRCICSSLHIHGNLLNICYYHRCPVHNDTLTEHDYTHTNIVIGQSNFVRFDKLPLKISTPQSAENACVCSSFHVQENSVHKHYNRCPVHNDTEEHNCTLRNTVIGRYKCLKTCVNK